MNRSEPLISIIIPTYNRAELLKETLDSVISQSYKNWECIIVDDGSIDDTANMLAHYVHNDARIKYYKRPDTYKPGGNGARNYGFRQSSGKYIKWFDSDNLLEKNTLMREAKLMQSSKPDLIISSWQHFAKEQLLKIEDRVTSARPTTGFEVLATSGKYSTYSETGSYSIHKDLINLSGLWNEGLRLNQDGEFFVRVCLNAKLVETLTQVAVFSRRDNIDKITTNYTFEHYEHRLRSWCLIKANLEAIDEVLAADYLKGYIDSMYFYLSNNYQWKLINKYHYLFKDKMKKMPKYRVYLIRLSNRIFKTK